MNIYLDNHATTAVDPRVLDSMLPYFSTKFGNASSRNHSFGWEAEEAVENARAQVAKSLGVKSKEIFFTAGATESNNLALLGVFSEYEPDKAHLITSEAEHPATLLPARELEKRGYEVTYLPVNQDGAVTLDQVESAIKENTLMVSLIWGNNEIGSLNPITEIGEMLSNKSIYLHVDAAQVAGKLPLDLENVHLLSLSAHKMYGPKGIGALFARSKNPRVRIKPISFGGGQERGIRPGTLATPNIVGLGMASYINSLDLESESLRISQLRDKMWEELCAQIPGVHLNGSEKLRLPGNLNFTLPELHRDIFYNNLEGLAYSTGSACATGSTETSHVLKAIGRSSEEAKRTLRLGLGRFTTDDEASKAVEIVVQAWKKSRR